MRELNSTEVQQVSGGLDAGDSFNAAAGLSGGFAVAGITLAATVGAPFFAGALIAGAIGAAGVAMFASMVEDDTERMAER